MKFVRALLSIVLLAISMTCSQNSHILDTHALAPGDIVMRVDPAEQEISLQPGTIFSGQFSLQNAGRQSFTATLSTLPYQVLGEDYQPDFSTANSYTEITNWITFAETELTLAPGTTKTVKYTVTVPTDVPAGGQYAAILVETSDANSDPDAIRTVGQIAVLVYADIAGDTRISGELLDQTLPSLSLGQPPSAAATLRNDGNIDFRVTETLTAYDFFTGRPVLGAASASSTSSADASSADATSATATKSFIVLPGTTRRTYLTWDNPPAIGLFRAQFTVAFLDQSHTIERVILIFPLWLLILLLVFFTLLIIWLLLRRRKNQV